MKLTKRACEDLSKREPESGKRTVHWDDELKGFGVRHSGIGQVAFVLKFRVHGNHTQRWVTLGSWPNLFPDEARAEARIIKGEADLGRDILAEREAERAAEQAAAKAKAEEASRLAVSVAGLLDAWRLATEAEMAKKAALGESVLYERELLRIEAKSIRPVFEKATVGTLDPRQFQALLNGAGSLSVARNLRAALVRFLKFANDRLTMAGLHVDWPTTFRLPNRGRARSRTHRYTVDEAAALWIAAGDLGRRGALIRFLLLTASRRIEAQKVEWSHIRFDDPVNGSYWEQPAHLTKNKKEHRVPLSPPAVALLRWLPPRETKKSGRSELIFAGRGGKLVGGWTDLRRELLRLAGVDDGTLHDIRRTVVSTLGDHGFDPQVVDTLLNHSAATTMGGVMGVYQRSEFWSKRREAIELWSDLLLQAVGRRLKIPEHQEGWWFPQPFTDARIRRPANAPIEQPPPPPAPARRGGAFSPPR